MKSIGKVIAELAGIPNALGHEAGDPPQRPRRRAPGVEPSSERIAGEPIFDSGRWHIADRNLWEEAAERARRAVEADRQSGQSRVSPAGIEALAWYVSFHDDQRNWGIYIPLSSLAIMDELYLGKLPIGRDPRLRLAWSALLLHEQMHFAVDHACAWFELLLRAPIRREFMERFRAKAPLGPLTVCEPYLEIEETAANAHMLRQLKGHHPGKAIQTVENFVTNQPRGYREGLTATSDTGFAEAASEALRSYYALWAIEHRLDIGNGTLNLSRLLPLDDKKTLAECPVYAIDDLEDIGVAAGSVRLIQCISEIVESTNFERQLRRQDPAVRRDWSRMKDHVKIGLPSPPRFEKLKDREPPTWSLRLRAGHRVHLERPDPGTTAWRAVAIGNHKEMGHGSDSAKDIIDSKRDIYRAHPSCICILLVRQDRVEIIVEQRAADGWQSRALGAADDLVMPEFGLACPVKDVYRDTPLG